MNASSHKIILQNQMNDYSGQEKYILLMRVQG